MSTINVVVEFAEIRFDKDGPVPQGSYMASVLLYKDGEPTPEWGCGSGAIENCLEGTGTIRKVLCDPLFSDGLTDTEQFVLVVNGSSAVIASDREVFLLSARNYLASLGRVVDNLSK